MELFSDSSTTSPNGLGPWMRSALRPVLASFTRLTELQQLYAAIAHLRGVELVDAVLRELDVRVEVDPAELRRLPATGGFVAVANHPSGLLDGLVLLHVLLRVRPELRAVATERLRVLQDQLGEQLLLVETDPHDSARNTPRLRHLLRQLHNDLPLLLFPAGEVAHASGPFQAATDPAWHPTAGRLLTVAPVPVVPIWLGGHNSASFSWLGLVHPLLRTARLPAELLNKRGATIRVRIGQPLGRAELRRLPADDRLPHLRARVYALGAPCGAAEPATPALPPVIDETFPLLIAAEIGQLRPEALLLRSRQWEVYVARAADIPRTLREIGRLRELTFRQVGEGTGRAVDLDAYDDYYEHLFLYDREARRLVGAYRLGAGRTILHRFGKRGFYLHSLFRFKNELLPFLGESLELGRSWIRTEYQRQPLPLALPLEKESSRGWSASPTYRYLIGPVSIPSIFSAVSKPCS